MSRYLEGSIQFDLRVPGPVSASDLDFYGTRFLGGRSLLLMPRVLLVRFVGGPQPRQVRLDLNDSIRLKKLHLGQSVVCPPLPPFSLALPSIES